MYGVELNPSVIESPDFTIALARLAALTSRPVRKKKDWVVVAAKLIAPVKRSGSIVDILHGAFHDDEFDKEAPSSTFE